MTCDAARVRGHPGLLRVAPTRAAVSRTPLPLWFGLLLAGFALAWSSYRVTRRALEWLLTRVGEGSALVAVARDQGR